MPPVISIKNKNKKKALPHSPTAIHQKQRFFSFSPLFMLQTFLPKTVICLSFESKNMGQLWTVLSYLHSLAGPCVMLLYPLYASIQAIESPSKLDDEQWLAYWILYSLLTLMEMVAAPVLKWVPLWYQVKVLLVLWLVLPQFRGASFMYRRFVREQPRKFNSSIGKDHDSHREEKRRD